MSDNANPPVGPVIISDEPTKEDLLGRNVYARTLQKVVLNCQTPMVIGIHGDWGSGKTSLMRQTEALLKQEKVRTVWFNPWVYQFDESPIVPLLHEIRKKAILYQIELKELKLLSMLTSAAGEVIIRMTTGDTLNSEFIIKQNKSFEKKYFEAKTVTMNLHEKFQEVVNALVGEKGRLVIFVDDLDRCCPPQSLKVLEAIKLFLSAEKCVYIVGMDRGVIEQAIANQYGELKLSGVSYLDKIIQLPFKIPPVSDEGINNFLDKIKQGIDLKPYYTLIRKGTGHNPRAIKRLLNTFLFNHTLAQEKKIENYKPHILVKLLILQLSYPDCYSYISSHKKEYLAIENTALTLQTQHKISQEDLSRLPVDVAEFLKDNKLVELIAEQPLIKDEDITPYIYLTNMFASGDCPKCGSRLVEKQFDSWAGDSDGEYPRYRMMRVCPGCAYSEQIGNE